MYIRAEQNKMQPHTAAESSVQCGVWDIQGVWDNLKPLVYDGAALSLLARAGVAAGPYKPVR